MYVVDLEGREHVWSSEIAEWFSLDRSGTTDVCVGSRAAPRGNELVPADLFRSERLMLTRICPRIQVPIF